MPSESVFEATLTQLKRTISHSSSTAVKSAAIRALGAVTFYGGASTTETQEVMEFFLEIIQSDGDFVNARDIAPVVVTALEEWGYLATQIEDMEGETASAIDSFVDQLDSADHSVQIAAGENIALLYEKSYSPLEEDEEVPQNAADESDPEDDRPKSSPKLIKRYTVYRQEHQLRQTLSSLASVSGRSISKKDKKSLHSNFSDILSTLDDPTRGPRYRAAVNNDTGKRYGSRLTVRIHRTGEMRIDTWWKLHRLKALRRVLQSGFINHYEHNSVVFDSLP